MSEQGTCCEAPPKRRGPKAPVGWPPGGSSCSRAAQGLSCSAPQGPTGSEQLHVLAMGLLQTPWGRNTLKALAFLGRLERKQ